EPSARRWRRAWVCPSRTPSCFGVGRSRCPGLGRPGSWVVVQPECPAHRARTDASWRRSFHGLPSTRSPTICCGRGRFKIKASSRGLSRSLLEHCLIPLLEVLELSVQVSRFYPVLVSDLAAPEG